MLVRHVHRRHHRTAVLFIYINQLPQTGRTRQDQVVGQQHCKRLVTYQVACAPHRMAKAHRLLLAGIGNLAGSRKPPAQRVQLLMLTALFQRPFKLERMVEMILDRRLVATGDEDDFLDPGIARLFHRVLNQRLVHHRQHLLGQRLGCRQKARTKAAYGKYCLTDGFVAGHRLFASTVRAIMPGYRIACTFLPTSLSSILRCQTRHCDGYFGDVLSTFGGK